MSKPKDSLQSATSMMCDVASFTAMAITDLGNVDVEPALENENFPEHVKQHIRTIINLPERNIFKLNDIYMVKSSQSLHIPSVAVDTREEAELIVALAKLLKSEGKQLTIEMLPYVFRVIGSNSKWT